MINQTKNYDYHSTRLQIEGLPDFSNGQKEGSIGIISSWKLQIAGFPELEGRIEHLTCLINVLYPYTRMHISGISNAFGDTLSPVSILPHLSGHELILRSSKKGIRPLSIILDDAELADLITCLDKLRTDSQVYIKWTNLYNYNLKLNRKLDTKHIFTNFTTPFISFLITFIITLFFATTYSRKQENIPSQEVIDPQSIEFSNEQ